MVLVAGREEPVDTQAAIFFAGGADYIAHRLSEIGLTACAGVEAAKYK